MTRPTPRPVVLPRPLPLQPQPERLDAPGGRTLPVMRGGAADYGDR